MKINPLLNELSRGLWAISFEGLSFWGPIAQQILKGEKMDYKTPEPKGLVNYYNLQGKIKQTNEKGNVPKGTVAVIDMIGPLVKYSDMCTYGADEIVEALNEANTNPNISAIVLNIDGPGGSVAAIAPFVEFGKNKTKPVIACYDMCCSAHLYAMYACADYVMASNDISATIGSIGVMLSWVDNKKFLEEKGYVFHEVYPNESANKNESFRLALEGNYDMIKEEMLSPLAIQFQNAVKTARPNLKLDEPGIINGKTYNTQKAIEFGLADGVGSLQEAINLALTISEMNHYINNY